MAAPRYNVFVGTETGLLKGVNTSEKYFKNVNEMSDAGRDKEICTMCWNNLDETQICCGLKNRLVKVYSTRTQIFEQVLEVTGGEGPIKSIISYNGYLLTCVESGLVKLWKEDEPEEEKLQLQVGENVCRMKQNPQIASMIATGGKENELKIWDLNAPKRPVFMAKNVAYDFLYHRVPVWVTDMQFYPDGKKIVTCTGYRHIRLYDMNGPKRRPAINIEFDEYPLTALSLTNRENYVIAGNTRGRMALFDLRKSGLMVQCYKGFAGSIRSIMCHPTEPLVASCGLDRFLRVHDVNSRMLIHKVYLKSRLNCLLFRSSSQDAKPMEGDQTDVSNAAQNSGNKNRDELWDRLEVVKDEKSDQLKAKTTKKMAKKNKKNFAAKKEQLSSDYPDISRNANKNRARNKKNK